jgi:hypothetical protein
MSDFSARITAGVASAIWTDPATGSAPTRLNPIASLPHRRAVVDEGAYGALTVKATVGGVEGPADAALGGRLFTWSWVEFPAAVPPPPFVPTAGSSSILTFAAAFVGLVGHWVLCCARDGGGAQLIPFDVSV